MQEKNQGSGWLFIPAFIGYVLCFAVPAYILSRLFPAYIVWFAVTAYVLMGVVAGIFVGIWWYHPDMTEELRKLTASMAVAILITMPIASIIYDAVTGEGWGNFVKFLVLQIVFAGLTYASFFISRAHFRRSASVIE